MGINGAISVKKWHFATFNWGVETYLHQDLPSTPNGIRTRAATLKEWWTSKAPVDEVIDQAVIPTPEKSNGSALGALRAPSIDVEFPLEVSCLIIKRA
jgi:hypothetical protein